LVSEATLALHHAKSAMSNDPSPRKSMEPEPAAKPLDAGTSDEAVPSTARHSALPREAARADGAERRRGVVGEAEPRPL